MTSKLLGSHPRLVGGGSAQKSLSAVDIHLGLIAQFSWNSEVFKTQNSGYSAVVLGDSVIV